MPKIPTYDFTQGSIQTGSTGPVASASSFSSVSPEALDTLAAGFQNMASTLDRVQAKEDMIWAQNQYSKAQALWMQKGKDYNDPERFKTEYTSFIQETMKQAPTGRASDAFVTDMNELGNRMLRKVIASGAKSNIDSRVNSLTEINAALKAAALDATPEDIDNFQKQLDKTAIIAKDTVPSTTIEATVSEGKADLERAKVERVAEQSGPNTVVESIDKEQLGTNLSEDETTALYHQYQQKSEIDVGVAKYNTDQLLKTRTQDIEAGKYFTTLKQDEALARAYALSHQTKKGENVNALMTKALGKLSEAKEKGRVRSELFSLPFEDQIKYLQKLSTQEGSQGRLKYVATLVKDWTNQKKNDPFTYALNSPLISKQYTTALENLDKATASGDQAAILSAKQNFKTAVNSNLILQEQAGVPEANRRVMSSQEAEAYADKIKNGDPREAGNVFRELRDTYGEHYEKSLESLQHIKNPATRLPGYYSLLTDFLDTPIEKQLASALYEENPKKGEPSLDERLKFRKDYSKDKLAEAIGGIASKYTGALSFSDSGSASSFETLQGVGTYAKYLLARGNASSVEDAAKKAYDSLIGSKYDFHELNGNQFLLPKNDPRGQPYSNADLYEIKNASEVSFYDLVDEKSDIKASVSQFYNIPLQNVTEGMKRSFKSSLLDHGQYVLSPDGHSLQIIIKGLNGGNDFRIVRDDKGNPIQFSIDALKERNMASTLWSRGNQKFRDKINTIGDILGPLAQTGIDLGVLAGRGAKDVMDLTLTGAASMGSGVIQKTDKETKSIVPDYYGLKK